MGATPSRRTFLRTTGAATAALMLEQLLDAQSISTPAGGRQLGVMRLGRLDARPTPPMHTLLGSGLDARQFTDISTLGPEGLITPTPQFFVRTSHPPALPQAATWQVVLGGRVRAERALTADALSAEAIPMGTRLMECSGNADPANFGLLSAARWRGVPIATLLDRMPALPDGRRIRITGVDDERQRSTTSVPGASWVFSRNELERTGAFLATHMNDAPLTPDHGAPIRLVVPNYYGCSAIKWVSRVDAVTEDEPATAQMREFAARTHQRGVPVVAREYDPPVIELAATPVRVEQWLVGDRVVYRVVGIRWGGAARKAPLTIRFRHTDQFVPVTDCLDADSTNTWSLWSHTWHPAETGRYQIVLNVADRAIPARRLDLYYYTREVEIDRV